MYNWNTNTSQLRGNKEEYVIWRLNQLVNFGLNGSKISIKSLKKYWAKLDLDPKRKRFLELLLK